jgi:lambda repressor-like predicted transcriptional regulator
MNVASSLIADLQTSWYSLHDLDRAQELKSIHQSGVSLRVLSSALNCSPSLLSHLLQAGQAPPEDCLLARQGLLSTRALVRRARTVGARRTALHREEIAYERELAALRFSQAIGRWLDENGVENVDRESVI